MPRVYIPQEPVKKGEDGGLVRSFNLSPAAAFGELVFVYPADKPGLDPAPTLRVVQAALANFGPNDYLLPVGNMRLIAWCAAIAARKCGGTLRLLDWDGRERVYVPTTARLY